ncbi:hypothetical protein F5887DRAFT_1087639 [Amanita rubescens]|nr:hypothetical protein F5887DRAFT_1087638 [Amanita rubescens]KAF8321062.1 hypothetical protein F5887DRAFT_1087639 [Amanita rubescens]
MKERYVANMSLLDHLVLRRSLLARQRLSDDLPVDSRSIRPCSTCSTKSHLANPSRLEHLHSPLSLPSPNAPSPPSLPSLRSAPGPLLLPSRVPTPEAPPPLESIAAFFSGAFTNTNTTPSPSHFHDGRELQTYRSHAVPFLLAVFATSTRNSSVVAFMTDKLGNYVGVDLAPDQDDLGYEAMSMMAMATAKATGAAIMLLAVLINPLVALNSCPDSKLALHEKDVNNLPRPVDEDEAEASSASWREAEKHPVKQQRQLVTRLGEESNTSRIEVAENLFNIDFQKMHNNKGTHDQFNEAWVALTDVQKQSRGIRKKMAKKLEGNTKAEGGRDGCE